MDFLSFAFLARGDMTMLLMSLDAGVPVIFEFFMPRFIITDYGDMLDCYVTKLLT